MGSISQHFSVPLLTPRQKTIKVCCLPTCGCHCGALTGNRWCAPGGSYLVKGNEGMDAPWWVWLTLLASEYFPVNVIGCPFAPIPVDIGGEW